jgi:hypothetical protein
VWNVVPMNYWPLFSFRMELSELRYTDESQTTVERYYFEDTLDVRAWSQERAVWTVREINSFRGTKLEKLFMVTNA